VPLLHDPLTPLELVLISVILVVVVAAFFEALGHVLRRLARRAGALPSTDRAIRDWVRVIWVVIAAAGILAVTGLANQFSVLTASGIVGLVISLALQTTLSNMISGALLLYDRAIQVGDVIEYAGTRGMIVRIALRNTWILNADGHVAVVGNTALTGGPLINHTGSRRMLDRYGLDAPPVGALGLPPTPAPSPAPAAPPPAATPRTGG
jgi:small conductance mechanosensitive channel